MDRQATILYFEDDQLLADMYSTKLAMAGFAVTHYNHPPSNVVEFIAAEKPDLIFTDIIMPVMDGFTATSLLQADSRTKGIPIFGMSNLGQREDVDKALSLGMRDYWIAADHSPTEVVAKLQSILDALPPDRNPASKA